MILVGLIQRQDWQEHVPAWLAELVPTLTPIQDKPSLPAACQKNACNQAEKTKKRKDDAPGLAQLHRSEFRQLELTNWYKHQVKNLHGRSDSPYPSTAVQPSLSDQDEDQIRSWLCIPSESNQVDTDVTQTTVELNHNSTNLLTPDAPEVAVMPSSSTAKRKDVALGLEKGGSTSHAAKAKKKTKENKGSRSQYQAVGLGSSGKKRGSVDTRFISPKRLRPPEVHRVTERKRRDKFNEKMKELQELLPRCSKLDKASTLDKAIGYIKDLQKQVWMMSGIYDMSMQRFPQMPQPCMPPVRMLSTEINVSPALHAVHTSMNPVGMVPLAPPPPPQYQHKPPPVNSAFQHSMASAAMFPFPQSEHPSAFPFVMQGSFQM